MLPSAKSRPPSADFPFKHQPFAHQREAFDKVANFVYAALFMEQGTGKTKVAIDRSAHLFIRRKIDAVLVLCPKSLTKTWEEEIETHCAMPYYSAVWDPALRRNNLARMEEVLKCPTNDLHLPFFIMNIEAVRTQKGAKLAHWFANQRQLHIIMDESSKIKTPSAKQTIAAINLARHCTARTILTGTPVSNSPADYFSQLNFLYPNPLGFNNFYSFRARYCVLEDRIVRLPKAYRTKSGQLKTTRKIVQIKGPKNAEELKRKLLPFSFFVKKQDCLDLPDKIYHTRTTELSKQGARLYREIKQQIVTEISESRELTVEFHLSRLTRLQQLTGGYLPSDDDPKAKPIPGINPKILLLLETLEQFPGPTLIWARYKAEHAGIRRALESICNRNEIALITGAISKDEREINRTRFQDPNDELKYLVCTQSCAGYGYTLTAAENEIYYSNTFSLEHREQSEDRAHRIGQTKHVNIIDLLISGTVDEKVIGALRSKRNVADLLTDITTLEEML